MKILCKLLGHKEQCKAEVDSTWWQSVIDKIVEDTPEPRQTFALADFVNYLNFGDRASREIHYIYTCQRCGNTRNEVSLDRTAGLGLVSHYLATKHGIKTLEG